MTTPAFKTIFTTLLLVPSILLAQVPESEFVADLRNEIDGNLDTGASRKRIEIARMDMEMEPVIDGALDDAMWGTATVISDLHQFQPVDHGQPTEESVFYIAYNDRYFYVGARLYDSQADGIIARQLVQGGGLGSDDAFEFILDTFNNGRTGYHFQVNPNGIRREGVYENPNELNRDWTGIWQVESRIDDKGWTAEVAIPFNTLNFDPETEEWGFTIARTIARKNEEMAWSSFNRRINPTTTGLISGIRDIRQGKGLDIIPSMTMANSENYNAGGVTDQRVDPSLNVFYKITPNLTGALTFNTDFSATEVDNRQVNLSRFSLFFPEKRDFFLQDLDIFSFGGLNQNGIPFYSRRIGLSRFGTPVDIDTGAKLTGRIGRWNVGGLAVRQGDFDGLDSQSVFAARVAANVLSESSVGAILTHGDPTRGLDNTVMGVDFRYQNTRFSDAYSLRSNMWYQKSDTEGLTGDDNAFGIQANLDTQGNGVTGFVNYEYFGEDFNPALGFANNTGVDSIGFGGVARKFTPGNKNIRSLFSFMRFGYTRFLDTGEMQSQDWFWRALGINTNRGDQIGIGPWYNREGLSRDFAIRPGVIIPAGDYSFGGFSGEIRGSNQRTLSPSINFSVGDYYNGERTQIRAGIGWRPNQHINLGFSYNYQDISLPVEGGDFDVRIVSANANYAFNSKWSWINLIQYDNFSNIVGLNSRLRWNPQAGEDLYLVVNYNFQSEGVFSELSSNNAEIVLKYTKTLRF